MKKIKVFYARVIVMISLLLILSILVNQTLYYEYKKIFQSYQELYHLHKETENTYQQIKKDYLQLKQKNHQLQKKLEEAKENQWAWFKATYYDAGYLSTGKQPGDPLYGITRSGRPVQEGITVAVDPTVIPLGSWIEIQYPDGRIEKRRADDTGGLVKGRHIDIYVPNANINHYHVRSEKVKVRLLSRS